MRRVRLLATDLDGTLVGPGLQIQYGHYAQFGRAIRLFRSQTGARWVVCTGRNIRSTRSFLVPFALSGERPDFLITSHAYIFQRQGIFYFPHVIWNIKVVVLEFAEQSRIRHTLRRCRSVAVRQFHWVESVASKGHSLRLRFADPQMLKDAIRTVRRVAADCPYLQVFEHASDVEVRAVPFTKGLSLQALALHLKAPTAEVLAIGDGLNDLSMVQPDVAGLVGCPANAVPELMREVHMRGGHVARAASLAGTVEILDAYLTDQVRSDLPEDWVDPSDEAASPRMPDKPASRKIAQAIASVLLLLAVCYTVLLVFAHFGLIRGGDRWVTPYVRALETAERWLKPDSHSP